MSGAISVLIAGAFSSTPSTDQSMGSATYTAGRWYVIIARNRRTVSTAFPPVITGGSIAWDSSTVADQAIIWNSNNECITTFFGFCTATETATLHLTWTDAQTTCTYFVGEMTGDFTTESVAKLIVQNNHLLDSTSTAPSLAFASGFVNPNNVTLAICSYAAVGTGQTLTKDPNLTQLSTNKATGIQVGYMDSAYKQTEEATVDWTKSSATASTHVIFELRIAPPPSKQMTDMPARPARRLSQVWDNPNSNEITPLVAARPMQINETPNPVFKYKRPQDWVANNAFALIGQDKIYGGPGMVPDYDLNPPTLRARRPVQDWIRPRDVSQYIDQMYGAQGQVPPRDLNPPVLKAKRPVADHIGPNLVFKDLAIAPTQDISLPVLRARAVRIDWVRTDAFRLIGQDSMYGGPGQVPAWIIDNPVVKRYPVENRTWVGLRSDYTVPPIIIPYDYPLPQRKPFPVDLRSWVVNGVRFFPFSQVPTYGFDNPVLTRRAQQPQVMGNDSIVITPTPPPFNYRYDRIWQKPFPRSLLTQVPSFIYNAVEVVIITFDEDSGAVNIHDEIAGYATAVDGTYGNALSVTPSIGNADFIVVFEPGSATDDDIPPSGLARYKPV